MARCLFFLPGPVPPDKERQLSRFAALSKYVSGDVIQTSWDTSEELRQQLKENIPGFNFHFIQYSGLGWVLRFFWHLVYYIYKGLQLSRKHGKYDVVACYGLTKTAIAAYTIKVLTGAKMIIEVPCNPAQTFIAEEQNPSRSTILRHKISQQLVRYLFRRVDGIRLLYPQQLDGYEVPPRVKTRIFHEYLPISQLDRSEHDQNFLLMVGFPWYLKGVDVLIHAFKKIAPEFPDLRLKILGYMTDQEKHEVDVNYRKGDPKIEFLTPAPWLEAMAIVGECKALVLASRSEAMGRVWLEAMALGKPVICSAVDGIPHYVKHRENGLLFESEDVDGLAGCITEILTNNELRHRLVESGYKYAHEVLNEENYVDEYHALIEEVLANEETGPDKQQ